MKMASYLEIQAEVYRCIEELKIDSKKARVCSLGWSFTVIASMPEKGITMKINSLNAIRFRREPKTPTP
jgi:hypothetical protein